MEGGTTRFVGPIGRGTTSHAMKEIMAALLTGRPFMPTTEEERQALCRLQELGLAPIEPNARMGLLPAPAAERPTQEDEGPQV